ncbi:hypothetical protein H8959_006858, partial [Pygathrix nigripes]
METEEHASSLQHSSLGSITLTPSPYRLPPGMKAKSIRATVNSIRRANGGKPEDEADYYCCTWHGNSKTHTVLQTHEEVRQKPPFYSPGLVKSPLLVTLTKSNSGGDICCHTNSTGAPTD